MYRLVEVFSVSYKGGSGADPIGTISVFDGKSGQIIYRGRGRGRAHQLAQNEQNCLPLTGPYRGISAEGCVSIEINFDHACPDGRPSYVAEILIDIYDKSTEYDVATKKEVKTCTCHKSPTAEVAYAILSEAVEATFQLELGRVDNLDDCFSVIARSNLGEVVLFESNKDNKLRQEKNKDNNSIKPSLARSVIAVPFGSLLKIVVCVHSNGVKVESIEECYADMDSKHELSIHSKIGTVQVTIVCSD